jgi:hypothetical protein
MFTKFLQISNSINKTSPDQLFSRQNFLIAVFQYKNILQTSIFIGTKLLFFLSNTFTGKMIFLAHLKIVKFRDLETRINQSKITVWFLENSVNCGIPSTLSQYGLPVNSIEHSILTFYIWTLTVMNYKYFHDVPEF